MLKKTPGDPQIFHEVTLKINLPKTQGTSKIVDLPLKF